jgi:DNA-binding MarR family transcriptional regulator
MPSAASHRRINEAISAMSRFARSPKLDVVHAERSGIDLKLAAYGVLGQVIAHGPVTLSELSHLARMPPSALSRQVKLLEEGGHITRTPHTGDARVALVQATARGRAAHDRVRRANDDLLARQLAGWTDAELDHLAAQMQRLLADLRAGLPAPRAHEAGPEPISGRDDDADAGLEV